MSVRWRRISATLPALVGWMIQGERVNAECIRGLPKGTVAVGTIQEDLSRVSLIVEHESFDEIRGYPFTKDDIPIHPAPTFRTVEQQQVAVEDRARAQFDALVTDLGLIRTATATPEALRVTIRDAFGQLQAQLKTARTSLLPLQDRIAQLESAAQSRT